MFCSTASCCVWHVSCIEQTWQKPVVGWACRKGCTEGGRLRVAFMADEPLLWMRMACLYTCPMKQHCTYTTTMLYAQSCFFSLACLDDAQAPSVQSLGKMT